jgi:GAF domain-containing protein
VTHEQIDPRVRRTHKLLQEALLELAAERGFDAVTVGDIARRASVNRATFYRHYQDKNGQLVSRSGHQWLCSGAWPVSAHLAVHPACLTKRQSGQYMVNPSWLKLPSFDRWWVWLYTLRVEVKC